MDSSSSSSFLSFFLFAALLAFLATSVAVFASESSLKGLSTLGVAGDVAREFQEVLLVLILHRVRADGEWANELGQGQGTLLLVLDAVLRQDFLASLLDASGRVAFRNVGKGA